MPRLVEGRCEEPESTRATLPQFGSVQRKKGSTPVHGDAELIYTMQLPNARLRVQVRMTSTLFEPHDVGFRLNGFVEFSCLIKHIRAKPNTPIFPGLGSRERMVDQFSSLHFASNRTRKPKSQAQNCPRRTATLHAILVETPWTGISV